MQGAPEEVIGKCKYTHNRDLAAYGLPEDEQKTLKDTIAREMCKKGQIAFSYAHKVMKLSELEKLKS